MISKYYKCHYNNFKDMNQGTYIIILKLKKKKKIILKIFKILKIIIIT
jgi:hypothetical protein